MSAPSHSERAGAWSGPARLIHAHPPHSLAATAGERRPSRCSGSKSSRSGTPTTRPRVSYVQPCHGQLNRRSQPLVAAPVRVEPRCWHTLWNAATEPSAWRLTMTVSPWPSYRTQSFGLGISLERAAIIHEARRTCSHSSSNRAGSRYTSADTVEPPSAGSCCTVGPSRGGASPRRSEHHELPLLSAGELPDRKLRFWRCTQR